MSDFRPGDRVMIVAKTAWCAAVDGWRGQVTGHDQGYVRVELDDHEGHKVLFVPPAELAHAAA